MGQFGLKRERRSSTALSSQPANQQLAAQAQQQDTPAC